MTGGSGRAPVRLAELVAALSLGIDLGFGQPMEHVLRESLIAIRIAEQLDVDDSVREAVYYTGLLVNVGCHSDAHEQAKWFGDDIALKAHKYDYPPRSIRGVASSMRMLGRGNPPLHRFRLGLAFAVSGHRDVDTMIAEHADIAATLAEQLMLRAEVVEAIAASYEYWDGRGWPNGLRGKAIPLPARIAQLAEYVEVAHRLGGIQAATTLAKERAGSQFDPSLADLLCEHAEEIFGDLNDIVTWSAVVDSDPALGLALSGEQFDAALSAIANFVDLKSPYFLGHAQAVADLCSDTARGLRLPEDEAVQLRRAALVHGLGRLGVSNAILDKPGPLGPGERERVRLQPYLTERMLQSSPALAPLGALAVQHRERLDGSGYPRGRSGSTISRAARILGTADAYQAMREPRPYRAALTPEDAAAQLRTQVRSGRFDAEVVDAVLRAVGQRVPVRRLGPAGLTPREVEVLRLLALGMSNKEIGTKLVISPKTARNHVEHIYTKIDATSRATASLFAMQHGLLYDVETSGAMS